jgi:hypothetical protein
MDFDPNADPDEHTLTFTSAELHIMRLALFNWDGYDMTARTTVTNDDMDETRWDICGRITASIDA